MSAHDLDKLPRWAKDRLLAQDRVIAALRGDLADAIGRGPDQTSPVAIIDHVHGDRGLPRRSNIRYTLSTKPAGDRHLATIDVGHTEDGDMLSIRATSGVLVVRPECSNSAYLTVVPNLWQPEKDSWRVTYDRRTREGRPA